MREPNFFLVGAPKAGTTSLYHYLSQHPEIYMSPIKEPCYFSQEARPENYEASLQWKGFELERDTLDYLAGPMEQTRSGGIVREWGDYLRLFRDAMDERAVGEASVNYLVSKSAPEGIARRIPQARILMVLRSPADRAFAQYRHNVSDGLVTQPFRDYVRTCLRCSGEGLGIHEPFLEMGFYGEQVQRYLDHFRREQLGVWLYEDATTRSQEFLGEVFRFLEVDGSFTPDLSKRYNQPRIPRSIQTIDVLKRLGVWQAMKLATPVRMRSVVHRAVYRPSGSLTLEPRDRALMLDFYRSDIHRLEGILNRDLSAWLR